MEKLLNCERYAYAVNEVVAKNDNFGGIHIGGGDVGFNIAAGRQFSNHCVLNNPWQLPINIDSSIFSEHQARTMPHTVAA